MIIVDPERFGKHVCFGKNVDFSRYFLKNSLVVGRLQEEEIIVMLTLLLHLDYPGNGNLAQTSNT